ncbi:NACHT domain-containing NTPase [Nocardiopsis sp. JB363]|uniref:NACHT domain-containing protein n=1 Tax=Nocardiopsis sp. JB363 TaxID=1434837 RepID=UPI00097B7650|nr:NACHT domain-containing protein [Nocardiopsis sp. JB363]SIO89152.1 putative large ATP-binding protein [Nocardiopsis sp. JB363]
MFEAALKLGVAVVKAACGIWIGNPLAESAATTVADLVQEKVTGSREQRRLKRRFDEIEESVAERVLGYLDHEFRGLAENEREAAVLAVADTFDKAGLTDRTLFEQDLDPLYLERYLRAKAPRATRDLSQAAVALYDRVLPEACAYVMATLSALPRFQTGAFTELLRRETLLLGKVEELLDRVPRQEELAGRERDADAAFLTAYRRKAAERWDVLELFGTEAGTRRYPLSTAYLSLRVSGEWRERNLDLFNHDSPYPTGDLRVEQVLALHRRTFLRGPAGSGKTTLLRWVGVRAGQGDFPETMSSWTGSVPFLVPLREYVERELPEPADFVRHTGRHLADQAPAGWATKVMSEGRGIVLLDGVDELPQSRREAARRWLSGLLTDFPDCRYVVTTRPGAASESWLDTEGFTATELQPLGEEDVRAFIHHWHEAVRGEVTEENEREVLTRHEAELTRKVLGQRHLRSIASTPLLCALLCALHRDRHTSLPRDRMEVYEAALAMLLKERDHQRGVPGVDLSRRELVLLLQELAKWLILNGSSDAPITTVKRQVGRLLAGMHHIEEGSEEVFTHLRVRSGLLQCPTVDRVSFLHRTFEEYLAAKALVEEDSLPLLVKHAHDDQWHEVVVMAAGHATPAQREELVTGLLERADQVKKHHDRLLLVAFACLETSHQLAERLHSEVTERVQSILPPRTKEHVHTLNLVGEAALPLLARTPPTNAREAAKSIKAASRIGGPSSYSVIEQALPFRSRDVFYAAREAWERDPSSELAEVLLADTLTTYPYVFPIRAEHLNLVAPHIGAIEQFVLKGHGNDSIETLSKLPQLVSLILWPGSSDERWEIDLDPLRGMPSLRILSCLGQTSSSGIAPLTESPLEQLHLSHPDPISDLGLLSEMTDLKKLGFGYGLPQESLRDLLPVEPLNEFSIHHETTLSGLDYLSTAPDSMGGVQLLGCPELNNIEGLVSQSGSLTDFFYYGEVNPKLDLSSLRELPLLEVLKLSEALATTPASRKVLTSLSGVRLLELLHGKAIMRPPAWLRDMPRLRTLRATGSGDVDLTDLAGATGLTIEISAFGRRNVIGAKALGPGSRVIHERPTALFRSFQRKRPKPSR